MDELLASKTTKQSITQLLMHRTIDHMKKNRIDYVIAGNHATHWSLSGTVSNEVNNHEEADTLLISCLVLATDMIECSAVDVYSTDTDVFLLLLSHSNQINWQKLYIHLAEGWDDLKCVHSKLWNDCSIALLSLHAITGTDTTGKFDGRSPIIEVDCDWSRVRFSR